MTRAEKAIEQAQRNIEVISLKYGVPASSIVWMGGNKFIIASPGHPEEEKTIII